MNDSGGKELNPMLAESGRGLDRVEPVELAAVETAGALVVDIRPVEQCHRDGDLPGAVVIDRKVLEWRLARTSPHRLRSIEDPEQPIVLVCDEGVSSSLAARTLQLLGLPNATDLCGGYQAWMLHVGVAGGADALD